MLLGGQESQQFRQSNLNRFPDDIQIDVEVAISDPVTQSRACCAGSRSYGTGLFKNLLTKFQRKVSRRQQVDCNSKQIFKLDLKPAEIKQGGTGQGIHQ